MKKLMVIALSMAVLLTSLVQGQSSNKPKPRPKPAAGQPARAIIFIIDGLNWQAPERLNLSNIQALAQQGVKITKTEVILPHHPTSGEWARLHNSSIPNPAMLAGSLFITPDHKLVQEAFDANYLTAHCSNSTAYQSVNRDINYSMLAGDNDDAAVDYALNLLKNNDIAYMRIHLQNTGSSGMKCAQTTENVPWRANIWGEGSPYVASAKHADELLGRFVRDLQAMNQWDDTLLVVTADHGQANSGWHPLLAEDSWVCPTVFIGPGVAKGKTLAYAEHIDIVPTILEKMGQKPINQNGGQGMSLAKVLQEPDQPFTHPQPTRQINEILKEYILLRSRVNLLAATRSPVAENVLLINSRKVYDMDNFAGWYKAESLEKLIQTDQEVVAALKATLAQLENAPVAASPSTPPPPKIATAATASGKPPVVGLDCYHNLEPKPHYTWDATDMGGYAELGKMLEGLGAKLANIDKPFSAETLAGINLVIITDPDIPSEAPQPNYLMPAEIEALAEWVKKGGVLILMGNNPGNAEFEHLNNLARGFGIIFEEKTADTGGKPNFPITPDDFGPVGAGGKPDPKQLFAGVQQLHVVGMCPLEIKPPAREILTFKGQTLMAYARSGNGLVYAIGDPWVYNEYINHQNNRACFKNIMTWLLSETK